MSPYLSIFGIAFFISLITTPIVARLAFKIGAVDRPNSRKVHDTIMPRLGGLAVFIGFMAATLAIVQRDGKISGLLLGGSLILLLGIVDDIRSLPPKVKLAGQLLAALVVVYFDIRIVFINNPFNGYLHLGILSIPITIFWIIAVTNAVNLIDGLDGLASGVSAIALLTFAYMAYQINQHNVSLLSLALVGATLGFLRYNFFPAKIFLGDTGSMFLGFMISVLSVFGLLKSVTVFAFIIPIIVLGVPIFDTCFAIFRRYCERKPIFAPDKKHIHHRLLNSGLSHKQTVLVIYGISLFFSFGALLVMRRFNLF